MNDTIRTVTLTPQEQAAFESGWNRAIEAAANAAWDAWSDQAAEESPDHQADAIRALSMPAPAQAWRDISTAPKDGTIILAYRPQAAETGDPVIDVVKTTKYPRTSFQGVKHYTDRACHPTHWMPLPAPPAALIPDTEGGT